MKRVLILIFGLACVPVAVRAQVGCLPPEQPFAYAPPDDPELREMINEDYQAYVENIEDYLNCLRVETARATREAREVVQRWVKYYGDEAGMSYDNGGSE